MSVFVIAEAGVNHNGSLDIARTLIDVAAQAGADAVKFQTFKASAIASVSAPLADYQGRGSGGATSQLELLRTLELDEHDHEALIEHCAECGIEFMSTPFDLASVDLLTSRFKLPRIKVASGDITNAPLLHAIARAGVDIILSTGMSTLSEVEAALSVIAHGYLHGAERPTTDAMAGAYASKDGRAVLAKRVVLLHCTTEYPTPLADVNLRAMDTLRDTFQLPVGYSDHTEGITVPVAAVARGAVVLEKHFTTDRALPGPDHQASLEPAELRAMITAVRQVEESLGSAEKAPAKSETANRAVARKSLVAARSLERGVVLREEDIAVKRPGNGISPMHYWEQVGRVTDRAYTADEQLD